MEPEYICVLDMCLLLKRDIHTLKHKVSHDEGGEGWMRRTFRGGEDANFSPRDWNCVMKDPTRTL